jgi:hypothetical protein
MAKFYVERRDVILQISAPMTPVCPVCAEPMQQNGRAFQCEPYWQIVIFFKVSDASPYLETKRQSSQ